MRLVMAMVFGFTLLLSALVAAPKTYALSAARVEPSSGLPGTTFSVFVSGLQPSDRITCQFFGPNEQQVGLGPCFGQASGQGELVQNFITAEGYSASGLYIARFFNSVGVMIASTSFQVVLPQQRCFTETGQCIQGRFLKYWYERGALFFNGFPLSGEFTEVLGDGKPYVVQYFERVRLEYHPENQAPYDVLLGQFGRRIHPADQPVAQKANTIYFMQTGHNVEGIFASFLAGVTSESPLGLEYFGYPLSESFSEKLEDGNTYTVQYFERARLEAHANGQVILGQFGRRFLPSQSGDSPPAAGAGWLDYQTAPNWNSSGAALATAPPIIHPRDSYCPPVNQGTTVETRAVITAGWVVAYGLTVHGNVAIVLGESGADGMCRPVQYQVSVFVGGRFAGTLSPILMDARTDGAFSSATINAEGDEITAIYVRYSATDALCCPSRINTVKFTVNLTQPFVTPKTITTVPRPVQ